MKAFFKKHEKLIIWWLLLYSSINLIMGAMPIWVNIINILSVIYAVYRLSTKK